MKGFFMALAFCTVLGMASAASAQPAPFECPWTPTAGPIPGPIGSAPP